jgi:hypothetical protein
MKLCVLACLQKCCFLNFVVGGGGGWGGGGLLRALLVCLLRLFAPLNQRLLYHCIDACFPKFGFIIIIISSSSRSINSSSSSSSRSISFYI